MLQISVDDKRWFKLLEIVRYNLLTPAFSRYLIFASNRCIVGSYYSCTIGKVERTTISGGFREIHFEIVEVVGKRCPSEFRFYEQLLNSWVDTTLDKVAFHKVTNLQGCIFFDDIAVFANKLKCFGYRVGELIKSVEAQVIEQRSEVELEASAFLGMLLTPEACLLGNSHKVAHLRRFRPNIKKITQILAWTSTIVVIVEQSGRQLHSVKVEISQCKFSPLFASSSIDIGYVIDILCHTREFLPKRFRKIGSFGVEPNRIIAQSCHVHSITFARTDNNFG